MQDTRDESLIRNAFFERFDLNIAQYVHWIQRFISWSGKRHPSTQGEAEASAYPCHLAVALNVAAATRNQPRANAQGCWPV